MFEYFISYIYALIRHFAFKLELSNMVFYTSIKSGIGILRKFNDNRVILTIKICNMFVIKVVNYLIK